MHKFHLGPDIASHVLSTHVLPPSNVRDTRGRPSWRCTYTRQSDFRCLQASGMTTSAKMSLLPIHWYWLDTHLPIALTGKAPLQHLHACKSPKCAPASTVYNKSAADACGNGHETTNLHRISISPLWVKDQQSQSRDPSIVSLPQQMQHAYSNCSEQVLRKLYA